MRRCTKQRLCDRCRIAPEYRIVTRGSVLKHTNLSPENLDDNLESVGAFKNCRNPCFKPIRVYFWKDVFRLLLDLGLDIPDNL